jgi:SNF2 family DNA or RNA helicase
MRWDWERWVRRCHSAANVQTLQTISFLAHLRSKGTWGPFLIVCPLSVLNNWIMEFEKFTPSVPVSCLMLAFGFEI